MTENQEFQRQRFQRLRTPVQQSNARAWTAHRSPDGVTTLDRLEDWITTGVINPDEETIT